MVSLDRSGVNPSDLCAVSRQGVRSPASTANARGRLVMAEWTSDGSKSLWAKTIQTLFDGLILLPSTSWKRYSVCVILDWRSTTQLRLLLVRVSWRVDGKANYAALKQQLGAAPGWRNWQTQRTQNPPRATSWGFDPPSRHQQNKRLIRQMATHSERPLLFGGCFGGCWFQLFVPFVSAEAAAAMRSITDKRCSGDRWLYRADMVIVLCPASS